MIEPANKRAQALFGPNLRACATLLADSLTSPNRNNTHPKSVYAGELVGSNSTTLENSRTASSYRPER